MKTKRNMAILAGLTTLALAAAPARAGDREWATAGKILTGVALVNLFAGNTAPAYQSSHTVEYRTTYCPPPEVVEYRTTYYPPPPVVVYPSHGVRVYRETYCPPPVYVAPRMHMAPRGRYEERRHDRYESRRGGYSRSYSRDSRYSDQGRSRHR